MNVKWTIVLSASALALSFTTVAVAGTRTDVSKSKAVVVPQSHSAPVVASKYLMPVPTSDVFGSTHPVVLTAAAAVLPIIPTPNRTSTLRNSQVTMRKNARTRKLKLEAEAIKKARAEAKRKREAAKKAAAKKAAAAKAKAAKQKSYTPVLATRSASLGSLGGSASAQAAQIGLHYIGVPYRWAGASPSGFDCSGFVLYAYAKAGVSLPHSSSAMYHMGTPVSENSLAVGDLVFFDTDGAGPSHVGIYVGGGRFVNATTSRGVRVCSLSGYWQAHYIGARRL